MRTISKSIDKEILETRLVEVLNASDRPRPLSCIAYIKYPQRDIAMRDVEAGMVEVRLALWGHEYKCRTKPYYPVRVDCEEILDAFNQVLAPRYKVVSVLDTTEAVIVLVDIGD